MAKGYEVLRAFNSPSLNRWITRDTAHLVPKLSDGELSHALKTGAVREVALPAGTKTVAEAQEKEAAEAREATEKAAPTTSSRSGGSSRGGK